MLLKEYYQTNKQFGNRFETDFQLIDPTGKRSFSGVMDQRARFVQQTQLLNEKDWLLFIDQFRSGTDDHDAGWRGEYFGKMMRGSCMTYQYTQDEALYQLLSRVADTMLETQDADGRFSTYSLDCEFNGWDIWSRKYVLLGLLHFHEICRDESQKARIIAALEKHLDYIVAHIGTGKKEIGTTSNFWGCINSASILEPVMKMYNITGKQSYLDFAHYIIGFLQNSNVNIFTLALEDKLDPYQYPVVKAYEMMSCFEGLLEYYRLTGEEKWKETVIRFADRVKNTDITIIGCAGCEHELFNHAVATQTDTDYTGIMQETCVTVTWMKLCNHLLTLTGDAKYADWIEQSFYNALYGAVNLQKCKKNDGFIFDSYSPLTLGTRGRGAGGYKDIAPGKHYGCCAAIGAAGTALPLLTAVTAAKQGIAINYYETATVSAGGFRLTMETNYPADGQVRIRIEEANEGQIRLRIPAFSGKNTCIRVNGVCQTLNAPETGSFYAVLNSAWKTGDCIDITFDMHPQVLHAPGVEGKPASKQYLAITYGPLVLARDSMLSEVGTAVPDTDEVTVTAVPTQECKCLLRAQVQLGNRELTMIDYGSAGKCWDGEHLMEAWLKTEIR